MKWRRTAGIVAINYHKIAVDSKLDSMCVTPTEFETDLHYLKAHGYQSITLNQLADHMEYGASLPAKPILISFDDGYRSHYEIAFPLLKRFGFHANFNVVVKWVGLEWTMTWAEMAEMERAGVADIQSHTYNQHRLVTNAAGEETFAVTTPMRLPPDNHIESPLTYYQRLFDDFSLAKHSIEEHFGRACQFLCYPYNKCNEVSQQAARAAGYRGQIWGRGLNRFGDSIAMIKRSIRYPVLPLRLILWSAPLQGYGKTLRMHTLSFKRRRLKVGSH